MGSHFCAGGGLYIMLNMLYNRGGTNLGFGGGGELGLFVEDHTNIGVQKW